MTLKYETAKFLTSELTLNHKKNLNQINFAFLGYSNSGKSSVINSLVNIKNLAITSKTPGRTCMFNIFNLYYNIQLIDCPGYGYSHIPKKEKKRLMDTTLNFIKKNKSLKGIINIMDIRTPLKKLDLYCIKIAIKRNIPILVLLNKSDKLNTQKKNKKLLYVKNYLNNINKKIYVTTFSAKKKIGIFFLKKQIEKWHSIITNNMKFHK